MTKDLPIDTPARKFRKVTLEEAIEEYKIIMWDCDAKGLVMEEERVNWAISQLQQLQRALKWQYCTEECAKEMFDAINLDVYEIELLLLGL